MFSDDDDDDDGLEVCEYTEDMVGGSQVPLYVRQGKPRQARPSQAQPCPAMPIFTHRDLRQRDGHVGIIHQLPMYVPYCTVLLEYGRIVGWLPARTVRPRGSSLYCTLSSTPARIVQVQISHRAVRGSSASEQLPSVPAARCTSVRTELSVLS